MTIPENQSARRSWIWLLAMAVLIALRLAFPFRASDTMLAHSAVVDSLTTAHNWGRQALVGTFEYPLLPTLALLAARVLCAPFAGLDAGLLLVAVCQAWGAVYVFRLVGGLPRLPAAVAGMLCALFGWELLDAVATADPNWVLAPLLGAAIHHLALWHRDRDLRDAVLAAVDVGLMAFAGLAGIAFGFAILLGMARQVTLASGEPKQERNGLKWLIWTPFCYCLLLLLLWNWLIMDSPGFLLGRLLEALQGRTATHVIDAAASALGFELGWFALGAMLAAGLSLAPGQTVRTTAASLSAGLLAVVLVRTVSSALDLYPAACGVLLAGGSFCLVGLIVGGADWRGHRVRVAVGLAVLVAGLLASHLAPGPQLVAEARFAEGAPPRARRSPSTSTATGPARGWPSTACVPPPSTTIPARSASSRGSISTRASSAPRRATRSSTCWCRPTTTATTPRAQASSATSPPRDARGSCSSAPGPRAGSSGAPRSPPTATRASEISSRSGTRPGRQDRERREPGGGDAPRNRAAVPEVQSRAGPRAAGGRSQGERPTSNAEHSECCLLSPEPPSPRTHFPDEPEMALREEQCLTQGGSGRRGADSRSHPSLWRPGRPRPFQKGTSPLRRGLPPTQGGIRFPSVVSVLSVSAGRNPRWGWGYSRTRTQGSS